MASSQLEKFMKKMEKTKALQQDLTKNTVPQGVIKNQPVLTTTRNRQQLL